MELKVISFNIRCRDDENGHSIEERAPRLYDATAPFDADVIGFQEYRPKWEAHIEKFFGKDYEIFNKYRSETTKDVESSPILWKRDKFECLETGYFWLSDTPEVESRGWDEQFNCFRMCVWATLRHRETGKSLRVMNTHFGFGDEGQIKSVKLIEEKYRALPPLPTLLVGDFNMTPSMPAYTEMVARWTDVNTACKNDLRTTFHCYHPEKYTEDPCLIDYCFVKDPIKPLDRILIDTAFDGRYPSDHFGLFMQLDL